MHEKERARTRECVCVCMCVCVRVRGREREREREKERKTQKERREGERELKSKQTRERACQSEREREEDQARRDVRAVESSLRASHCVLLESLSRLSRQIHKCTITFLCFNLHSYVSHASLFRSLHIVARVRVCA